MLIGVLPENYYIVNQILNEVYPATETANSSNKAISHLIPVLLLTDFSIYSKVLFIKAQINILWKVCIKS